MKYSKLWDVLSYLGDEKYWKFLVEMVENIEIQVHKQLQPICAVLNKSIYCCCMVSAWTYFLLASLLFPPWILENIFNILYIMQVLAKSLGILWCTKNEKIVKNQHKNLTHCIFSIMNHQRISSPVLLGIHRNPSWIEFLKSWVLFEKVSVFD